MLKEGEKAPDFQLQSTDGQIISLSSLKGKKVVLYFYPKDNTPGCTKEACDMRDNYTEIKNYAEVFGISADNNESHKKFTEKFQLPFQLLSDTDNKIAQEFGVYTEKSMFGKKYMGIQRSTFIINEEGIIQKVWPKVNVITHISQVLKELKR